MKVFNLPDLGEGLPDAEIVEWLVKEGDPVELDQPMVSMETAKAVVEVPSPYSGRIVKLHGRAGDVIQTGAPLCEFQVDGESEPEADAPAPEDTMEPASIDEVTDDAAAEEEAFAFIKSLEDEQMPQEDQPAAQHADEEVATPPEPDSGAHESPATTVPTEPKPEPEPQATTVPATEKAEQAGSPEPQQREDTGTVVGNVQSSNEVLSERTSTVGGVKVTPAVRAMARKLKVDISRVQPSGNDGVVTLKDVRAAAERGTAAVDTPARTSREPAAPTRADADARRPAPSRAPAPVAASGEWEPIRGPRRTMIRAMSESHKNVVPTTLMDDADIHAWRAGEDITARLLRSLWTGAQAEPGLNAWFDGEKNMRMIHKNMHVGMAVDTADGLFVAALRNVNQADRQQIRQEINRLRDNTANRSIPPEDLKDYTIVLSNFGKFAGRYATPVVTPPCVAIVAAGALRHEVVPVLGGIEVHRIIPISLTFDHRACTGGEAARFLKAMLEDLAKPE